MDWADCISRMSLENAIPIWFRSPAWASQGSYVDPYSASI